MELQLSHLLSIDDSSFASDPTFAFVYWSILQKKEVAKDCSFRLKQSQFERMTNGLTQIPVQTLTELERKLQISPGYRPESPPECAALKILSQLTVMNLSPLHHCGWRSGLPGGPLNFVFLTY
jgi:hypothetical protein